MNGFEAYKLYISLKNHFSKENYNYFKYNGKSRLKIDSFEKRNDKVFFQKLAKHEDLKNFLISNFIDNEKLWVRDLAYSEQANKTYKDWLKRNQSLSYIFRSDLNKLDKSFNENFLIKDHKHPKLLKLLLKKDISIESACILCTIVGCVDYWNKELSYDPVWQELKIKIQKYTPFIEYDKEKMKKICLDTFDESQ